VSIFSLIELLMNYCYVVAVIRQRWGVSNNDISSWLVHKSR